MTVTTPVPTAIDLTPQERDLIQALASQLERFDPVADPEAYVMTAQERASGLPSELRHSLLRFRRYGDPTGGLLIRGLPVEGTPPTPERADDAMGVRLPAARVLSLVAATLGDQYGFMPELSGQIIQDILPVAGFEYTQHSISSSALLELHCETAFSDNRADFVGLLCLRPDPNGQAGTLLSPLDMIIPLLDSSTVATLRQPRFVTTVDGSFLRGSGRSDPIYIGPIRVLAGSQRRPRLRCDFAETRGTDKEAQLAIGALHAAASEVAIEVRLDAGDLLFIDNHSAFHGRTPFSGNYGGQNRWLLRTFIIRDLARGVEQRPADGRIVDADYAELPEAIPASSLSEAVKSGWV